MMELVVDIPPRWYKKLLKIAKKKDCQVGDLIRQKIEEMIKNDRRKRGQN